MGTAPKKVKKEIIEQIKRLGFSWMDIKPMHDRVLIKRIMDEDLSKQLIIAPDIAKTKPNRGVILAVGPGKMIEGINGGQVRMPCSVRPGDIVAFGRWNDWEALDEADMLLIQEGDVFYIEGVVDHARP